jgi:two-component system, sporulation sensor kinase B
MGKKMGVYLLVITLITRAIFGIGSGFWLTFIVLGFLTLIGGYLHNRFILLPINQKIFFGSFLSIISSIIVLVVIKILGVSTISLEFWISYIVIQALGTGFGIYAVDNWKKNWFLRLQIIKLEKNNAVSNMAAAISHEVRNPLTSIRGFLQLLKDNTFEEEKRKEFIEIAINELDHAQKIITDYLAYAKPEFHMVEKVDINNEIEKLLNILNPLANMNTVVIEKNLGSVGEFIGDRHQTHQCLMNIFKNCIEAMPLGGTLTINTLINNNNVHLIIQDTGIGMTQDQIRMLGEPYFSTKGSNGTGLGMMVAFKIITAMRGTINVESKIGVGTKFHIKLPIL